MLEDLRYAPRTFASSLGLTATAMLSLALASLNVSLRPGGGD